VKTCEVGVTDALNEIKVTWVCIKVALSKVIVEFGMGVITHQLSLVS
jgi:hypothetical protein